MDNQVPDSRLEIIQIKTNKQTIKYQTRQDNFNLYSH